jgi:hypothetical protein
LTNVEISDQGLDSRVQLPARSSETQRIGQVTGVNAWVKSLLDIDAKAKVVIGGDINDFGFFPVLDALTADGAPTEVVNRLPRRERYGYVYNGNTQVLDHILTSRALRRVDYDIVHSNAEFAEHASDHDPQVLRIGRNGGTWSGSGPVSRACGPLPQLAVRVGGARGSAVCGYVTNDDRR